MAPTSSGRSSFLSASSADAARLRMHGNELLKQRRVAEAIEAYTQVLMLHPDDPPTLSNRAYAHHLLGRHMDSAQDAARCIQVLPTWWKGYMRLAAALSALHEWQEAVNICMAGLQHAPESKELLTLLTRCQHELGASSLSERCQRQALASTLDNTLQQAQQASLEADLKQQLSQSMAAPGEWDPEDFAWRPTWLTESQLPHTQNQTHINTSKTLPTTPSATNPQATQSAADVPVQQPQLHTTPITPTTTGSLAAQPAADASIQQQQQRQTGQSRACDSGVYTAERSLLLEMCRLSEECDAPSEMLAVMSDCLRVGVYAEAIRRALGAPTVEGVHVLCLGPGAVMWGLLSAQHTGAASVTVVCDTASAYRATRAVIAANEKMLGSTAISKVQLAPVPLHRCKLQGSVTEPHDTQDDTQTSDNTWRLPGPIDWVITDSFTPGVLGTRGPVTALHTAATHGLLSPHVRVLPASVRVLGELVCERHMGVVQGLDMSRVNTGRWYPGVRPVSMRDRDTKGIVSLSRSTELAFVDLQALARMQSATPLDAYTHTYTSTPQTLPVRAQQLNITPTTNGICNGLLIWPELTFDTGGANDGDTLVWDTRGPADPVVGGGNGGGVGGTESTQPGGLLATAGGLGTSRLWQPSIQQSLMHWEPRRVNSGQQLDMLVIAEATALHVLPLPYTPSIPKHTLLPTWHQDLITNELRTTIYQKAIREAVHAKAASAGASSGVVAMHLGAGTGFLSLLTARLSSVAKVYALEARRAVASLALEVLACNPGLALRTCVLPGSLSSIAKRLLSQPGVQPHPDVQTLLSKPADVLVLENLDAGVLGEGVLHCLALGRATGLLSPATVCIPKAAKMRFQLVHFRPTSIELGTTSSGAPATALASRLELSALLAHVPTLDSEYLAVDLRPRQGQYSTSKGGHRQQGREAGWVDSPGGVWRPMSDVVAGMNIDFQAVPAGLPSPGSAQYQVTVTSTGCVNAVAFWPCLDMHGEDRWDLGPWASGGGGDTDNDSARDTHMEVAVQPLGHNALHVSFGDTLCVNMSHDTYSFKFSVTRPCDSASPRAPAEATTGNSIAEPSTSSQADSSSSGRSSSSNSIPAATQADVAALSALSSEVARVCTQDPLAYRRLATTAVELASRPVEAVWQGQPVSSAHIAQIAAPMFG